MSNFKIIRVLLVLIICPFSMNAFGQYPVYSGSYGDVTFKPVGKLMSPPSATGNRETGGNQVSAWGNQVRDAAEQNHQGLNDAARDLSKAHTAAKEDKASADHELKLKEQAYQDALSSQSSGEGSQADADEALEARNAAQKESERIQGELDDIDAADKKLREFYRPQFVEGYKDHAKQIEQNGAQVANSASDSSSPASPEVTSYTTARPGTGEARTFDLTTNANGDRIATPSKAKTPSANAAQADAAGTGPSQDRVSAIQGPDGKMYKVVRPEMSSASLQDGRTAQVLSPDGGGNPQVIKLGDKTSFLESTDSNGVGHYRTLGGGSFDYEAPNSSTTATPTGSSSGDTNGGSLPAAPASSSGSSAESQTATPSANTSGRQPAQVGDLVHETVSLRVPPEQQAPAAQSSPSADQASAAEIYGRVFNEKGTVKMVNGVMTICKNGKCSPVRPGRGGKRR